jgi:CRISPR-associated Cas5-like protein
MILSVKPLGPLHLSLRQIPSPAMRAFYEQETIPVPLPSTIMGALGSALGIRLSGRDDGMFGLQELRSRLAERFGGQFRIWGPLIKLAGREDLYMPVAEGLCPLG